PILALAVNDGPEAGLGTEPSSAPSAVPGPADASGMAAQSAGALGVSALTAASVIASGPVAPRGCEPASWVAMNVMAQTVQVAFKAFIAADAAARSQKERYTHVPRSLRRVRHARCFNGECPSEATDKIGLRHIYWTCCQNATATQRVGCTTATAGPGTISTSATENIVRVGANY